MLIDIYNQKGEKQGTVRLPKEVFCVKVEPNLVHQVVVSQASNRRQGTAHTKDRSEVRGGGRKPWRQKGTGRARHGSIRSPLWRGGGVTFGPRKERVYKKTVPKKMKRKAMLMGLSAKAEKELLIILDNLKITQPQTREVLEVLSKLPCKQQSCLVVLPAVDKNIILAARNIPEVQTIQAKDLNALDLLSFKYVLMPKLAIKVIKETFVK